MASNRPHMPWCLALLIVLVCVVSASGASEIDILMKFKKALVGAEVPLRDWNPSVVPCTNKTSNWGAAVLCLDSRVYGLQLERMGLSGLIDIDSLTELLGLRTISFMNNNFEGPMPDITKLGALKNLYLSNNRFSGEIPTTDFDNMVWLKKIYLASNEFTGPIPSSLTKVPKLLELRLDGNQFQGRIPDFPQKQLTLVNVSDNQLVGPIPESLRKMDSSLFSGNPGLCGSPLQACHIAKKKPSKITVIVAILVIVVGSALLLMAAVFILLRRRHRHSSQASLGRHSSLNKSKKMTLGERKHMEQIPPAETFHAGKKADHGKLVFVRDDGERFDLNDLLRASAEVLGSGTFGSSYKAALLGGPVMVVKRFRQMSNVGKEDFQEHMRRLGRLRHPNLLSLVAYYYKKEEKLLVSDFVNNGSLAYHLHGNRMPDSPALDWPTRLNILKGIAKGLTYLYNELPSISVAHGHLKSSNVLLNASFEPLLSDYCLMPVVNRDHAVELMVAYKSPEYAQYGRLTRKTDAWSLGILILEMITGKFPENYLTQSSKGGSNADLAKWVNSVVREEWTGEVFDNDMKGTKNVEGEMLKLLKIGMECCENDVDSRLDLNEAIDRIEELRERNNDHEDDYSSFASEGDYSRAMTEEEFSFSMNS